MMTPEGRARAQAELDRDRAALDAKMAACRYCKQARKRGRAGCRKHRDEGRLIYATSPISETYWAS